MGLLVVNVTQNIIQLAVTDRECQKNDAEDNVRDCLAEGLRHWLLRYDAGFSLQR
jgi:hypothetical protein